MENSESVSVDAIAMSTSANSPIQGGEGSHGEGEKGSISPSPQLELKTGDDAVAEGDAVEKRPIVEVGVKRKAAKDIDPFGESDTELPSNDSKGVNSLPISPPIEGQQVDEEMVPQEGGDSGKVEGDKGMPRRRIRAFDLNKIAEPDATENMEVEPYAAENIEVKPSAIIEKVEVEPSAAENKEVEIPCVESKQVDPVDLVDGKIEAVPYAVENNEKEPSAVEKNEVKPYAEEKKKEEEPSSAVEKIEVEPVVKNKVELAAADNIEVEPHSTEKVEVGSANTKEIEVKPIIRGFRSPMDFDIDLNELPPKEGGEN